MGEKMERFTQRSRRVLSFAQSNAEIVGPWEIMPCHILLAFTQEEGSVAYRVMLDLSITTEDVIKQIQAEYPREAQPPKKMELSQDTKRVLEMAVDEARRMGHHYIGTEHLLLGILRVSDRATKAVFVSKEAGSNTVRNLVNTAMQVDYANKSAERSDAPNIVEKTQKGWWYKITAWLMELIGIKPLGYTVTQTTPASNKATSEYFRYKADIAAVTSTLNHFPNYPSPSDLYRKRGIAHMWLGHYEDSVADLTKAIEAKPEQIDNYLVRIVAYELQGELTLALQDCNTLVRIAPDNKSTYNNRTSIYAQLREFEKAEADLETSFQITQAEAERELGLAELAYHKGEYASAIQHFQYIISILPANHAFNLGIIYWQLGKALDSSGDSAGAADAFETSIKNWHLPPLKRSLMWLQEMRAYVENHRPQA